MESEKLGPVAAGREHDEVAGAELDSGTGELGNHGLDRSVDLVAVGVTCVEALDGILELDRAVCRRGFVMGFNYVHIHVRRVPVDERYPVALLVQRHTAHFLPSPERLHDVVLRVLLAAVVFNQD